MRITIAAACLLTLAMASPAAAQAGPDDLHCFLLSNFFGRSAKDDRSKAVAAQSSLFYLGKLDGHLDQRALATAMHDHLDPKLAGTQMMACARHVGTVEQNIQNSIRTLAPKH